MSMTLGVMQFTVTYGANSITSLLERATTTAFGDDTGPDGQNVAGAA